MSFDGIPAAEPVSSDDSLAIRISGLGKCFHIYDKPLDRLKQFLLPGLSAAFRGGRAPSSYYREFWALRDVSFIVRKGETIAVIGLNGSGKSTLLQMIAGTLTPTAGSIEVHGRVAALLELGSGFNPEFTGRENVYLNAAILGLSRAATDRCLDEILAFADIGDFIDQPVKTYSSGMMMRLAFAVSVHVEPDILIVDEALAVGDAAFQFKCLERLEFLRQAQTTLLFVSHDIAMVKAFCSQAIYLASGAIRSMGLVEDVTELYIQDLNNARKKTLGLASSESSINPESGVRDSASTDLTGQIRNAVFANDSRYAVCQTGERVTVRVDAVLDGTLKNPAITFIVQDRRLIAVSGQCCRIGNKELPGSAITVEFCFYARLRTNKYYITLLLEESLPDRQMIQIERHSALLVLEVVNSVDTYFIGIVDMQMECSCLPQQCVIT